MCPQFNVLFEHLTVEEHLWFFASLKRTPPSKVREEVDTFMKNVGLADKAGCFASNLSGMFNSYSCFPRSLSGLFNSYYSCFLLDNSLL